MRAITIQGSYVGSLTEMEELIELVKRTGLPPVPVATRPLDDVNAALGELRAGKVVGRVVLTPALISPREATHETVHEPIARRTDALAGEQNGLPAELRAMQAPIKDRYKSDAGRRADHAEGQGHARRQEHRLQGRDRPRARGRGPASGDRRLGHGAVLRRHAARGAGRLRRRDLKAVSTALAIPLKSGNVSAEGDLDFRGTLGVAKDAPVGFAQIRLRFDVDTDAPQDKLDQLLKLTERYCVVYQTIKQGPPVEMKMQRVLAVTLRCEHLRASKGDGACARAILRGPLRGHLRMTF